VSVNECVTVPYEFQETYKTRKEEHKLSVFYSRYLRGGVRREWRKLCNEDLELCSSASSIRLQTYQRMKLSELVRIREMTNPHTGFGERT
jgi:hypothetical protein